MLETDVFNWDLLLLCKISKQLTKLWLKFPAWKWFTSFFKRNFMWFIWLQWINQIYVHPSRCAWHLWLKCWSALNHRHHEQQQQCIHFISWSIELHTLNTKMSFFLMHVQSALKRHILLLSEQLLTKAALSFHLLNQYKPIGSHLFWLCAVAALMQLE